MMRRASRGQQGGTGPGKRARRESKEESSFCEQKEAKKLFILFG
jgi:hypothetical protein